jgi:hypothetical protein
MDMANNNPDQYPVSTNINITIDVTKIVKYACCAGIIIVGFIFGTRFCHKLLKDGFIEL